MKIKFFKKEKKFKKESSKLNLNLSWKTAIWFMIIVALLASFFGYYFFRQINTEVVLEAGDAGNQMETVKKERMEKALEYFSLRKKKSVEIINSPASVIDPSL